MGDALHNSRPLWQLNALPTESRRYGRLKVCATLEGSVEMGPAPRLARFPVSKEGVLPTALVMVS